jgi:hypothetical protein
LKMMMVKRLGAAFSRWRVVAAVISIRSRERTKYENDLKALTSSNSTMFMFTHSLARGDPNPNPNPNHMSPLTNTSSVHASPLSKGSPNPNPKGDLVTIKKRILEQNNINIRSSSLQGLGSYTDEIEGGDFNDIDTAEIDRHAVMTREYLDSKNAFSGADLTEEELELRR